MIQSLGLNDKNREHVITAVTLKVDDYAITVARQYHTTDGTN